MGAKYDQLDLDERIEMSRLYEAGTSRREIGRIIGRSASTVGRELRRNTLPRGGYKPASADRTPQAPTAPEQIAGRLGRRSLLRTAGRRSDEVAVVGVRPIIVVCGEIV